MARRPPMTSPTARAGFPLYVDSLAWVLANNARQVGIATADRRDAVVVATGMSEDEFEWRSARYEARLRERHPDAVAKAGCWAADILASFSSKVIYERLGLDLKAKRLAREPAHKTFDRKARALAASAGKRAA